jgi:8-oxo-dGTP diphosphatase
MTKDTKKVVVALIQNNKGKYLMTLPSSYKDYGEYQDAWCFPAGHVHEKETEKDALMREIKEELNIKIEPIRLITEWDQDIPGEKAYWWECKALSDKITNNFEISQYNWYSPQEMKHLKIWPAMTKFLTKYIWNENSADK